MDAVRLGEHLFTNLTRYGWCSVSRLIVVDERLRYRRANESLCQITVVNVLQSDCNPLDTTLGKGIELRINGVDCICQINQLVDKSLSDRCQANNDADSNDRYKQDVFNED